MEISDLTALDRAEVRSEDGRLIGKVTAAHVDEGTEHVRFMEVDAGQSSVLVPTGGAAVTDRVIAVPYLARDLANAPKVEAGRILSVGEVVAVAAYFNVGAEAAEGQRLTDRPTATTEQEAEFVKIPLPPIVFSLDADPDASP